MEQQKAWMELTEKEVKSLGFNRYLRKHWRRKVAQLIVVIAFVIIAISLLNPWTLPYKIAGLVLVVLLYGLAVWDISMGLDRAGKRLWEEVKPQS